MKYYTHRIVVAAHLFTLAVTAEPTTNGLTPRIVGGTPVVDSTKYPGFGLPSTAPESFCGSYLIHEDILLSAAHCEGAFAGNDIYIGGLTINGEDAPETIFAETELLHPDYGDLIDYNDIMLIKLISPSKATPANWNTDSSTPADQATTTTIGFGLVSEYGDPSDDLLEVEVKVDPYETCRQAASYEEEINDETMICASAPGKDSCYGDSGGPMFDTVGTIIGLVSFGTGECAEVGYPGVYTRVSTYDKFIRDGICELSENPPSYCGQEEDNNNEDEEDEDNNEADGFLDWLKDVIDQINNWFS